MKQDKQLKAILTNSAEKASVDFTDIIMNKVTRMQSGSITYQPLVSPKLKKLFLILVTILVLAIAGICLMISTPELPGWDYAGQARFNTINYNKILLFLISFWIVFAVNAATTKRKFYM